MKCETAFIAWLDEIFPETPPTDVVAYCFNIAEVPDAYEVELIGASSYSEGDPDWPCDEVWTSRPNAFSIPASEYQASWELALEGIKSLVRGALTENARAARHL